MTLPSLFGTSIGSWAGLLALLVALIALGLAMSRTGGTAGDGVPADQNTAWQGALDGRVAEVEGRLASALQHAALVRYDAFPGAGGQFSFSACVLDGVHTGLLLTAISNRDETRLYAKWVEQGRCRQALSPEEEQALARAVNQARGQEDA